MVITVFGFHRGGMKVSIGDIRMDYTKHRRRCKVGGFIRGSVSAGECTLLILIVERLVMPRV